MGTGGPFAGAKARPGRDTYHSPPSSAEIENEWKLYLLSPMRLMACSGTALALNNDYIFLFNYGVQLRSLFSIGWWDDGER
jgi:hypothetical protein